VHPPPPPPRMQAVENQVCVCVYVCVRGVCMWGCKRERARGEGRIFPLAPSPSREILGENQPVLPAGTTVSGCATLSQIREIEKARS
jgi:hypothetical protein